jgi:hypothetical protein
MDTIAIVVSLVLIGLALAIILYPLWQQTHTETPLEMHAAGQTLEELQVRYEASLAAIKDLMFDYEMGKVSTEDYETLLNRTKVEAARIRQQIDQLSISAAPVTVKPDLDREIEQLIAQMRRQPAATPELRAEVEAEIEALKTIQPELLVTSTCPSCGRAIRPGDAFCSGCGRAIPQEATCSQCGYAYQPDDAFCARCGAVLKAAVEVPNYEDTAL